MVAAPPGFMAVKAERWSTASPELSQDGDDDAKNGLSESAYDQGKVVLEEEVRATTKPAAVRVRRCFIH